MNTQYLDTMEAIGRSNNTKTIFMDNHPGDMLKKKFTEAVESVDGKN